MKLSDRWFANREVQSTRTRVSTLPVLARVGPDNPAEAHRNRNKDDEKYFEVDGSEVDGEEVVG